MQRAADALNGRRCDDCDELQVDCQCGDEPHGAVGR